MKLTIRHTGNSSLSGRAHDFDAAVIRIGRKPGNDIIYDPGRDHLVSGDHAELRVSGRHVTLVDLGSRNGTFVNGQRINAPTPVRPRDRITLGRDGPELALEFVAEQIAVADRVADDGCGHRRWFAAHAGRHVATFDGLAGSGRVRVAPARVARPAG